MSVWGQDSKLTALVWHIKQRVNLPPNFTCFGCLSCPYSSVLLLTKYSLPTAFRLQCQFVYASSQSPACAWAHLVSCCQSTAPTNTPLQQQEGNVAFLIFAKTFCCFYTFKIAVFFAEKRGSFAFSLGVKTLYCMKVIPNMLNAMAHQRKTHSSKEYLIIGCSENATERFIVGSRC